MPTVTEIPDLWGDEIKADVLSPLTILKVQAEKLSSRTRGLLLARTYTTTNAVPNTITREEEFEEIHHLEFFAPAINYTEEILVVSHPSTRRYPARIRLPRSIIWREGIKSDGLNSDDMHCNNEAEYLKWLQVALRSTPVRSAIDSILAMSNERNASPTVPPA